MGILTEGFSAYYSPVMLKSRKLTKDKRVTIDFRHLNVRIAKNNLTHPLVRDMFSVLGGSKCDVLSVLDLKDDFHSLRLSENLKRYCGILLYFGSASYLYQRMPMGLYISPSIWQSYINVILNCVQSKNIVSQSWMIFYYSHHQRNFIGKCERIHDLCTISTMSYK